MRTKKYPAPRWRAGGRVTLNSKPLQNSAAKAILEADTARRTPAADAMIGAACLQAEGTAMTSRERLALARRLALASAGEPRDGLRTNGPINSAEINRMALARLPAVLPRILPGGNRVGAEVIALNPWRVDRLLGSLKFNRYNGRWANFATGERGSDPTSLLAYLAHVSQAEAARSFTLMLEVDAGGHPHG